MLFMFFLSFLKTLVVASTVLSISHRKTFLLGILFEMKPLFVTDNILNIKNYFCDSFSNLYPKFEPQNGSDPINLKSKFLSVIFVLSSAEFWLLMLLNKLWKIHKFWTRGACWKLALKLELYLPYKFLHTVICSHFYNKKKNVCLF